MSDVAIVLATYDGARHVEAQIRSLQAQDHAAWRLFVRDDGSSDATRVVLAALAAEDARITVLEHGPRLGVVGNFGALLRRALDSGAEHVFLCDQDDVWSPTKVSRSLARMAALEGAHGARTPLLVHSDLEVVDAELRRIHRSFLRYQRIAHEERSPLQVLLVQNFVTGCATLVNRPLLELALPLPEACVMHDWWLAQCAAASGHIGFVPDATLKYRQHHANQVGATGAFGNLNPLTSAGRRRFARSWQVGAQCVSQAAALHERLRQKGAAPREVLAVVGAFAALRSAPPARRVRILRRLGIRRQRPLGTALLYLRTMLLGVADGGGRA